MFLQKTVFGDRRGAVFLVLLGVLVFSTRGQASFDPGTGSYVLDVILHGWESTYYWSHSGLANTYWEMSGSEVAGLARSANTKEDGMMLRLMRIKPLTIPDNHTDLSLAKLAGKQGTAIKRKAEGKIKTIPGSYIRAFAQFSPEEVNAILMRSVWLHPTFVVKPKPPGATTTTWASLSLFYAYSDIEYVALVKKSVVLKLMVESKRITIPASTKVEFTWSGAPEVVIDLSFPLWTAKDIPELRTLADNPHYGEWARSKLAQLGG